MQNRLSSSSGKLKQTNRMMYALYWVSEWRVNDLPWMFMFTMGLSPYSLMGGGQSTVIVVIIIVDLCIANELVPENGFRVQQNNNIKKYKIININVNNTINVA